MGLSGLSANEVVGLNVLTAQPTLTKQTEATFHPARVTLEHHLTIGGNHQVVTKMAGKKREGRVGGERTLLQEDAGMRPTAQSGAAAMFLP